jgi:glutamine synthetase
MAMLDGIKNKFKAGEALDKDIYDLEPEELEQVPKTPTSLEEALKHLERDHEFLLQGEVFTDDVIDTWIWYKREKEVEAVRLRPHPYEFYLYYDV